ncbi:MAG: transketolase [Abditibacteriota bacterium]|nr:transketolase [Abditibacteriota bacterium]
MAYSKKYNKIDALASNTIRFLAVDGIEKAKSGHPGLPMGMADVAFTLFGKIMNYDSKHPLWKNRDRFVLSGGHGSMLLYSCLFLAGYNYKMTDLKSFRQWGSKCAGHPEFDPELGIETTTGPLGQGIANAVGMAMSEKKLAATFNKKGFKLFDHKVYVMCGDGDLMEGISHEACSLAGTLKLDNIIMIYDDNDISIEGNTDIAFTEDVKGRFISYGWDVQNIDGHNYEEIEKAIKKAQKNKVPSLIIAKTKIGFGAPNKEGTAKAHGEPLGADEAAAAKKNLGFDPKKSFFVPDEVKAFFDKVKIANTEKYKAWDKLYKDYKKAYPKEAKEIEALYNKEIPQDLFKQLIKGVDQEKPMATRASSGAALQIVSKLVPSLFGGSADLAPSNKSDVKGAGDFSANDYTGKNLHFGVRELAMSAICNGIAAYGAFIPYDATFMVFSDYMKPALRVAALEGIQRISILTHDSIFVGEDGPTHEPIEQLAALRIVPNITLIRPADTAEACAAWVAALQNTSGPTCLALTRQNLTAINSKPEKAIELLKGAYVVKDVKDPDAIMIASGSEVALCLAAADALKRQYKLRVVSMPSMELFEKQPEEYKQSILPCGVKKIAVEAGTTFSWYKYVGKKGLVIGIDHFGASAPYSVLAKEFGFTAENVTAKTKEFLAKKECCKTKCAKAKKAK